MEDHPKHDKKKNTKAMPAAINVGVGVGADSLGMGGIVLFGGAVLTATIVSVALALRARRSSKKSRSEEQLESTVNTDTDVSLHSRNQSDEVTSTKEIENNSIQDLSREEYKKSDETEVFGDGILVSVVGEYEENGFEEKIALVETELDLCSKVFEEQEKYYCKQTNTGTQMPSIIEEYEAIVGIGEVGFGRPVSDEEEMPSVHVGEEEEEEEATMEVACVHEITLSDETDGIVSEAKDIPQGQFLEEGEDLTDEIMIKEENQQYKPVMRDDAIAYDEITIQGHEGPTFSNDETPEDQLMMSKQDGMVNENVFEEKDKETLEAEEAEMTITEDESGHSMEDDDDVAQEGSEGNGVGIWMEKADTNTRIRENIEENETILPGKDQKNDTQKGTQFHYIFCYSKLMSYPKISVVATLLFFFILLATWSYNHLADLII